MTRAALRALAVVLAVMGAGVLWLALSAPGARVPGLVVLGAGWIVSGVYVAWRG